MGERKKDLEMILAKLEKQRPELEKIYRRAPVIDTGREPKDLCRIPADADFTATDGNTEYEVTGHFNPEGDEYLLGAVIRKLGCRFCENGALKR